MTKWQVLMENKTDKKIATAEESFQFAGRHIMPLSRQDAKEETIVKTGRKRRSGFVECGPVSLVGNDACHALACVFTKHTH